MSEELQRQSYLINYINKLYEKELNKLEVILIEQCSYIIEEIIDKKPEIQHVPLFLVRRNKDSNIYETEISEALCIFEEFLIHNKIGISNIQDEINELYELVSLYILYFESNDNLFKILKTDEIYYSLTPYNYQFELLTSLKDCIDK